MSSKFSPGQSGNPKGRPKGIVDRRSQTRTLLEDALPSAVAKLVELVEQGNVTALRMLFDRTMPALRSQPDETEFALAADVSAPSAIRSIVVAMAAGNISIDKGKALIDALTAEANFRTHTELEERIKALEARK